MGNKSVKKIQTSGPDLKKNYLLILFLLPFLLFPYAYGHGVNSETFPPVELNEKLVTLEVAASDSDSDSQQISISLIDFESKITLRDVTFLIKSYHGGDFLFEQEFKADNGFLVLNFVSNDTDSIVIMNEEDDNFFGSLLGLESRLVHVQGEALGEGGLYTLDVSVLGADNYNEQLKTPLIFNAGISVPQTFEYNFVDPNFGQQNIKVITYYDKISNLDYDPNTREIYFTMPFVWSQSNINQTSVVHEEIVIPHDFGDLLASGFSLFINDIPISDDVVTVDDFSKDRIVHFIIYQKELFKVLENGPDSDKMNFLIKPDHDNPHLSSVTDNGQFRVLVYWDPENLQSNSNAEIFFDITDIFLKNKSVSTSYELSITQNDRIIFEQNGISNDTSDEFDTIKFMVPSEVSGIVHLNFNNLDDNEFSQTTIPIVIANQDNMLILDEIKINARLWADDKITNEMFIHGIKQLFEQETLSQETSELQTIPNWIKNIAVWWADDKITSEMFMHGIKYLIENEIITS